MTKWELNIVFNSRIICVPLSEHCHFTWWRSRYLCPSTSGSKKTILDSNVVEINDPESHPTSMTA